MGAGCLSPPIALRSGGLRQFPNEWRRPEEVAELAACKTLACCKIEQKLHTMRQ